MIDNEPLVSIAVMSYNNGKFIRDTLNSINSQSYKSIELVIVDDCSTDNSSSLILEWIKVAKYPVKVIQNSENLGIVKGCNLFLKSISTTSKYLCIIASDDMFSSDRISKQVATLENSTDKVAATFSDAGIINESGAKLLNSYYKMMGVEFEYYDNLFYKKDHIQILGELISHNRIPAVTLMYKTKVIKAMGGWDENLVIEDLDMNLKLIKNQLNFIPTANILGVHRKHTNSVTTVKRVEYLNSILEIVSKYKGINSEIDQSIAKNFNEYALAVYQRKGDKAAAFLKEKYEYNKGFKNLVLYKIASLGVPFTWIKPFYKLLSGNK